jgi:hypothetical protein
LERTRDSRQRQLRPVLGLRIEQPRDVARDVSQHLEQQKR